MSVSIRFRIEFANILEAQADAAVLKFARTFHGADKQVKDALTARGISEETLTVPVDRHAVVDTRGAIRAEHALYIGTPRLGQFRYSEIRAFTVRALEILRDELPKAKRVIMTLHGAGYGLDEGESAVAQFKGIVDAVREHRVAPSLEEITIVEFQRKRAQRLQDHIDAYLKDSKFSRNESPWTYEIPRSDAGRDSFAQLLGSTAEEPKPHAFVAMPFREEYDDVFHYGIEPPVHRSGLLCERVDQSAFTGDILDRIKASIDSARVVIADVSDASPNVYLEVGYAWGRGKPTILLANDEASLRFDIRNQRVLLYKRIRDLEEKLSRELEGFVR